MRNDQEQPATSQGEAVEPNAANELQTRRSMLRIGALGAAAVMTIRPGMAQAAVASALTCSISIPLSADSGKRVKKDGSLTNSQANGSTIWAFPGQPLKGEDVKNAIKYQTSLPGTSSNQTKAYLNYIDDRITAGKPGFTCYASLQSPNRY